MITPHGGKLISRIIEDSKEKEILIKECNKNLEIDEYVLLEIESIANGCFSPLEGFPSLEEIQSILDNWCLNNGTPFPIPPLFSIKEEDYNKISVGEKLILTFKKELIGLIEVNGKSKINKDYLIDKLFRTRDSEHPGVNYIKRLNDFIITGNIKKFSNFNYFFNDDAITPKQAREIFEKRGWKTITAFSTTNIPHSAHEYLQRIALEISDGLFIHALDNRGNNQKFTKEQIKESYESLILNYYPIEKVLFSFLPMLARSAGPRSSLLQAIIRQNYGCTSQIFGRDHEGFKDIYGLYESQEIFKKIPLEIKPLLLSGPFYCHKCEGVTTDKACGHKENFREEISGTRIRNLLKTNQDIPKYIMRKEVIKSLK